MMTRMLTQLPLPMLPGDAREIAPGAGVVDGPDGGGVVWVHGLATFAWDAGDEAARRLGQHPGHHPTSVSGRKPFIYFCGQMPREHAPARRKQEKRPGQQACNTP